MSFPIFQSIDEFVVQIKQQEVNQRENYIRRHSEHYIAQHHANANFQFDLCCILLDDNYRYLWSNQNQTTTTNEHPIVQDINNEDTREYQELRILQQRNSALENNERHRRESTYRRACFFNRPKFGTKCIKKNDSKTDEVCPICLDNNILTKNMLWFNCNHGVCSSCITELLKPKPSHHICPLCRKKIDDVCLKYNRSESTKNQIWQSENVKKILNSICM